MNAAFTLEKVERRLERIRAMERVQEAQQMLLESSERALNEDNDPLEARRSSNLAKRLGELLKESFS